MNTVVSSNGKIKVISLGQKSPESFHFFPFSDFAARFTQESISQPCAVQFNNHQAPDRHCEGAYLWSWPAFTGNQSNKKEKKKFPFLMSRHVHIIIHKDTFLLDVVNVVSNNIIQKHTQIQGETMELLHFEEIVCYTIVALTFQIKLGRCYLAPKNLGMMSNASTVARIACQKVWFY